MRCHRIRSLRFKALTQKPLGYNYTRLFILTTLNVENEN